MIILRMLSAEKIAELITYEVIRNRTGDSERRDDADGDCATIIRLADMSAASENV